MARTAQAIVKRNAIFVKEMKNGKAVFVRRPYDLVEYNWGDTTANATYLQPHYGHTQSRTERAEVYDDIRFYDTPPLWDICPGSGL